MWLIERGRIGPGVRALERDTDPLFRQAGLVLSATARLGTAGEAGSSRSPE